MGVMAAGRWCWAATCCVLLAACGGGEDSAARQSPVVIGHDDECHVCGMVISSFPGPKGEAYTRGAKRPYKFCSTRDLFSFLLQPENRVNVTAIYVHDMGKAGWEHPPDDAFVEARSAWYVADQPLKGAMGPTLASFARREDAQAFIEERGGKLLRFDEITLALLAGLRGGGSAAAD